MLNKRLPAPNFRIDEGVQFVIVSARTDPASPTVAETILGLLKRRPEMGGWDWIIDLSRPFERAKPEEIDQISRAFNAMRSRQAYTVFISVESETWDRCRELDKRFLDRVHLVAPTMAAARALLPVSMRSI